VISSSPTDLQPVFDTILDKATRLCGAHMGILGLYDGKTYHRVAQRGARVEFARWLAEEGPKNPPASAGVITQMIAERRPIHVLDRRDSPSYLERIPSAVALVELGGARTFIAVPMLKEGRVVGGIVIYRPEVRPFTQKQIDLVSTFANQAVIAIENVRLFKELQARNADITEALQQQTATSEILQVISGSPTDLTPVLEAVAHRAAELCDANDSRVYVVDGDALRFVGGFGDLAGASPSLPLTRGVVSGRAVIDRSVVHIDDLAAVLEEFPDARGPQQSSGTRTTLAVPLMRESEAFGAILMLRKDVRPFTEKQIALVRTFAYQAAIGIENVRLFKEIQNTSRQLEAANRHKSEFLANMSHELRTPLNAVIGFSDLLLERMFGEMNAKQENYMKNIQASGKHLLSLINDILDLSKIEAGRMELEVSSVHIPSALQNAMMLIRERAQRQNIALSCNVDPKVAEISADERKFKQVMLNLLSNAVKFTPEGGRVDVDARLLNGHLEVSVKDTGVGIAKENQQAVFEEFRQVGQRGSAKQEGTGLGLALTRRFVELHGGTIRLESELGKGSTFTFTIPVQR
jgi:signal transduction histidine kinase